MLATQIRQKDGSFYFVAYPAVDLLPKIRFMSRFYGEGAPIEPEGTLPTDDISRFIANVEQTDRAFQRRLSRRKVLAIRNFYETAETQPPIPGTVLLFTPEQLNFEPLGQFKNVGDLQEPSEKYLIVDGQHRLAALHFYLQSKPEEGHGLHVPCIIFDGRSEDFAAEMFVIINSTPTRINKSHLVDLYERVSWADPDKKFAARVTDKLYSEPDSPLRYKINRLGGRSRQEKWILQAELYNEVYRWVRNDWPRLGRYQNDPPRMQREAETTYRLIRDFLKASAAVLEEGWGRPNYMITRPVTLKALIRVCADLSAEDAAPEEGRQERWIARLHPWAERIADFRADGFYERFAAKGQVERVARLHRELGRSAGIKPSRRKADGEE